MGLPGTAVETPVCHDLPTILHLWVQEMRQAWGNDSIGFYSADTFNEQSPPTNVPEYLRRASEGVYKVGRPLAAQCVKT